MKLRLSRFELVLYGLPTDRITNANSLPMYLNKDNQSVRPYQPGQVLVWLNNGQISPFDQAIRQGEQQREPISMYFSVRPNQ